MLMLHRPACEEERVLRLLSSDADRTAQRGQRARPEPVVPIGVREGREELRRLVRASDKTQRAIEAENRFIAWLLRGAGFLMMAIGIGLIFAPLAVAADIIPFFGDLLRFGTAIFAAVVAGALTAITIAVGSFLT